MNIIPSSVIKAYLLVRSLDTSWPIHLFGFLGRCCAVDVQLYFFGGEVQVFFFVEEVMGMFASFVRQPLLMD